MIRKLLFLFLLSIATVHLFAQDEGLMIYGKMRVESGRLDGKMEVLKDGSRIRIVDMSGNGKFDHECDLGSVYTFVFSQDGFVTKKIEVNTEVKFDRMPDALPFPGFEFEVTLFEQYEGVNVVAFNQPVAKLKYNPEFDNFDYDTDYTKSIQEQLQEVEKEMEEKKKEIAKEEKREEKEEKKEKTPPASISSSSTVSREEPPTTPRKRIAPPPPPPPKKSHNNVVVLHSYTVGEMKYPNLNAYGFINFGDGAGRREITKEQFDEYAKKYH